MKRFIYPFLAAALALAACQKEKSPKKAVAEDDGSGSIVRASSGAGPAGFVNNFNGRDSLAAIRLMNNNSLSVNGLQFYMYQSYNAVDDNDQTGLFQIAEGRQIQNGLPLFFEDQTYAFENGNLRGPAPQSIVGIISLDNKPNLSLTDVRNIFVSTDNSSEAQNISIGDSTLVAQLGYYDLNLDFLTNGKPHEFVKAWYVHAKNKGWPQGYIRDDNSQVLQFKPLTSNGPFHP